MAIVAERIASDLKAYILEHNVPAKDVVDMFLDRFLAFCKKPKRNKWLEIKDVKEGK